MDFSVLVFVLSCLALLYWWHRYNNELGRTIEQSSYHAPAIVRSYRKEYVRVAGSWDWLDYPYVEYINQEGQVAFERLKCAESNQRLLEIGDEIEVVRYNGILYYRGSLHTGRNEQYLLLLAAAIATAFYFLADK